MILLSKRELSELVKKEVDGRFVELARVDSQNPKQRLLMWEKEEEQRRQKKSIFVCIEKTKYKKKKEKKAEPKNIRRAVLFTI